MIIEIEALDTLFFRDGKPFEKGDDVWATGMFPPLPSVIYGALRGAYLGQNDIGLEEVIKETKDLRIKNIWYKVKIKILGKRTKERFHSCLPLPLDLVQKKDLSDNASKKLDKYGVYETYQLNNIKFPLVSSLPNDIKTHLTFDENIKAIKDGIIITSKYEDYLKGNNHFEVRSLEKATLSEAKIGISRSNETRTTSEGNLYRVGMLRTDKIKIIVEFDGLKLEEKGIFKLGAENKLVKYQKLDDSEALALNLNDLGFNNLTMFKLCLTTPAIFENGFYPQTAIFDLANVAVELQTCSIGKSINVGGFNMQKTEKEERGPKVMYKAIPAGSVFYYKLLSGKLSDLEAVIKKHSISDVRKKEGFGLAYIGKV